MTEISVRLSDEQAARGAEAARLEGRELSDYIARQIEGLTLSQPPLLVHDGPILVPPGFDWSKAGSWDRLIEEAETS